MELKKTKYAIMRVASKNKFQEIGVYYKKAKKKKVRLKISEGL